MIALLCYMNKYSISKCIEQVRAKERRLTRERGAGRHSTIVLRRNQAKTDDSASSEKDNGQETIVLGNYKNKAGFFFHPRREIAVP